VTTDTGGGGVGGGGVDNNSWKKYSANNASIDPEFENYALKCHTSAHSWVYTLQFISRVSANVHHGDLPGTLDTYQLNLVH
jgi:hypothetical protein